MVAAEPAAVNWKDENDVTALMMASAYGHLPCAEVLCGAGAKVDYVNVWGSTPLINAAHNAHLGVVHFLVLHEASVSLRDKDGTALDGACKRLCRMMRGVCAATDDKHPDKPGLEKAKTDLDDLVRQTNRGPMWHKALEAAFVPFRKLLAQAEPAAANLALGKVAPPGAGPVAPAAEDGRPSSAASGGSKGSKGGDGKKKKEADDPEPPDAGRSSLYAGCAAYVRIIEMLRDPAGVRKEERLRLGGAAGDLTKEKDGLTQKVGRIRGALALDVSLSLPEALRLANVSMGVDASGSLPEQADRLVDMLGLR